MPDYGHKEDKVIIRPSGDGAGLFLFRSGSLRDVSTSTAAALPSIAAITCSANFSNRLTKLSTLNAYGIITLSSGSTSTKSTRLILRYVSASFQTDATGSIRVKEEITTPSNLLFTSSKYQRNYVVNVPLFNNDDSYAVALKTVRALRYAGGHGVIYSASLVSDGSNISNLTGSMGNFVVGSSFKVRQSASLDGSEGKILIYSLQSGSMVTPDFSGTKVQVGGMKVGSQFKVGDTEATFTHNIIQSGSGTANKAFYPGDFKYSSSSLFLGFDPNDKGSSVISGSGKTKIYLSSSGEIGIGTTDPKRAFDVRDESLGIAEIAIKKSRINETNKYWSPNDEIGSIRFIGQSGSFSTSSADPESSGSVFDIQTTVGSVSSTGITGIFKIRQYKAGVAAPETLYQISGLTSTHILTGPVSTSGDLHVGDDLMVSDDLTVGDRLVVDDFAKINALRVGSTATDPGNGNAYIEGDLTVVGKLNVAHITSSHITASVVYTSGSNIFGDNIDDTHTFNGHITASGNISASGTIIGTIDGGSF